MSRPRKPRYYVTTWDPDKQRFTPQKGLRCGPYSLWGLRKALRILQEMGYQTAPRNSASFVLIEREDHYKAN